jgi:NitT/TauT family transport system substrate-binding protein
VSRLLLEAGGKVYLEEASLWPQTGGRYVTTHLVSSVGLLREQSALLRRWIGAQIDLTQWLHEHPEEAKQVFNGEMKAETGRTLPPKILERAWSRLELTHAPIRESLLRSAQDAQRVGFLKQEPDLSRLYALQLLNAALRERMLPQVR